MLLSIKLQVMHDMKFHVNQTNRPKNEAKTVIYFSSLKLGPVDKSVHGRRPNVNVNIAKDGISD